MMNNQKGQITQLLGLFIFFFVILLTTLFVFLIMQNINTLWQASTIPSTESKLALQQTTDIYPNSIDVYFPLILVGIFLGLLGLGISSIFHPIFLGIYILYSLLGVIISGILTQVFQEMVAIPELASAASYLPVTSTIINNYPILFFITSLVVGVASFKLRSWGTQ